MTASDVRVTIVGGKPEPEPRPVPTDTTIADLEKQFFSAKLQASQNVMSERKRLEELQAGVVEQQARIERSEASHERLRGMDSLDWSTNTTKQERVIRSHQRAKEQQATEARAEAARQVERAQCRLLVKAILTEANVPEQEATELAMCWAENGSLTTQDEIAAKCRHFLADRLLKEAEEND